MEDDEESTEIIPARSGDGGGKTAMPFIRLPFGSFTTCFLAIIVVSVITAGVLCWLNRRVYERIQWVAEVLMIGKTKADENFRLRSQQHDTQGYPNTDVIDKNDSLE